MKKIIFFSSIIFLVLLISCKQSTEPQASDIYVSFEVESAFQDDSVKLSVDNKILLESRVTTNYSISLAWASGWQKLSRSNHTLLFSIVDYGIHKYFVINTDNDTSTVLLRFNKSSNQINIEQIKGMILRD